MNEQMMQMMMQLMLNNQQMVNNLFTMMTQPQPNPVLGTTTREQMAQTGAASTSVSTPQEVSQAPQVISTTEIDSGLRKENSRLKAQIGQMQAQIAEMQAQITGLENVKAQTTAPQKLSSEDKATLKKAEELKNLTGKSLDKIMENIKSGKIVLPKQGAAAQEAYAQMIEEGRLSRNTVFYTDSEDVIEAIEDAAGTNKTIEEILEKAEKETDKPPRRNKIEQTPVNDFGF